jgi:hypothetical protein
MTMDAKHHAAVRGAIAVIESQAFLPRSPGVLVDRKPVFCTAAAVVYAALDENDRNFQFPCEMLSKGKGYILQVAAASGLDVNLIHSLLSENDAYDDNDRRAGMLQRLTALQHVS